MPTLIDCLFCGVAIGCYTKNEQGDYVKKECGQQCDWKCPGPETKKVTHAKCASCGAQSFVNFDVNLAIPGRA